MTPVSDTDPTQPDRLPTLVRFVYGKGPKVLLGFHGIGQDHRCFMPLVEALQHQYVLHLFDLPFHGQSPPLPAEKLSMKEWEAILDNFLRENNIQHFSVAGFSMGGKFALATLSLFPERIESCWLLAPDGVTESPWYRMATRFWVSRWVFHFFVMNIDNFKKLASPLMTLGLIKKSAVKFAQTTLSNPAQRERVYRSWTGFSSIRVDIGKISRRIRENGVDIKVFLGKYDALLPARYLRPLTKRLPGLQPIVLKTGHHRLIEKVAEWFTQNPAFTKN